MSQISDDRHTGVLERMSRYLSWAAGSTILFCAVLVTLDVIARNLFNDNFFESYEITIYLYAITVAFSFSFALVTKTHIRIDVVYAKFPPGWRAGLDIIAIIMLTGLASLMSFYAWSLSIESFKLPGPGNLGAVSASDMSVPLVIPQSLWALGLTWFAFVCIVYLLQSLYYFLRGDFATVTKLIGVEQREGEAELNEALELAREDENEQARGNS
ncbi:MAG: TRAP transporter small permease [Alphaproteobacteria bacterium]|nr:TRAP transporter small permease [Alphaproteobacteria bacterium]